MKRIRWPIFGILLLAAVLRFYQIWAVPPSASLDEASIGYNAYSILKTGRDEYGTKLPILLRAYDDYRPALYVYFVVPFIQLFGITVTAVRLPSVILSILEIWLVYLIAKTLFFNRKEAEMIGIFSALLLAISPWHIYISRLGHEANLGLFFVIAGTYFFVTSIMDKTRGYFIVFSAIAFALSLWGYQSQKIVVPVLLFLWTVYFFKRLWNIKKWVIMAAILGVILTTPVVLATTTPDAMLRFQHTSALAPDDPIMIREQQEFISAKESNNFWGVVWYNRRLVPLKIIAGNYLSHFSLPWLFTGAKDEMFKAPYKGLMYPWELLFILVGGLALLIDRKNDFALGILAPILLTAPVAASLTTMAPHAMRSYTFLPAWQIIGSVGLVTFVGFLSLKHRKFWTVMLIVLCIGSVMYFMKEYFVTFPKEQSEHYQYALHQGVAYAIRHESEYNTIVVSIDRDLVQSYMFYLFDASYDPRRYLAQGGTSSGGFAQWHKIGKWSFRPINWKTEADGGNTLYLGNLYEFGPDAKVLERFIYLDGKIGVEAATKPL